MKLFDSTNRSFFLLLGLLFTLIAKGSASSETKQEFCRQGTFISVPDHSTVIKVKKNLHVESILECAHNCLNEKSCDVFMHRNQDGVNCRISGETGELISPDTNNEDDDWTLYKVKPVEPPLCRDKNFCKNGGRCIASSCKPNAYSCDCGPKFYGERCEGFNHDYDVIFPRKSGNSYVKMDAIKSNLSEFTLTCWFKIEVGSWLYPLLSYTTDAGSSRMIEIYFSASNANNDKTLVHEFNSYLIDSIVKTNTIPVNDGYWHHLGFTWSSTAGDWNLLIDGVLWGTMSDIKSGAYIPPGGSLIIGQMKNSSGFTYALVGSISRLNVWSVVKTGSEIELMATSPGEDNGNLINWYQVVDHVVGSLKVDYPSNASNTGEGVNYEITLGSDYAVSPGPSQPMSYVSTCLWFQGYTSALRFFTYNTVTQNSLAFGYNGQYLFAYVNNVLMNSSSFVLSQYWHLLCFTWNGKVGKAGFYYDGLPRGQINNTLQTNIPSGGNLTIGATVATDGSLSVNRQLTGIISQLNIWSFMLDSGCIQAMSSGGANINGNILSWKKVLVVGSAAEKTDIFIPGYTVLTKRTKWCRNTIPNAYARLGGQVEKTAMKWRCYYPQSLVPAKWTYNFAPGRIDYETKDSELIAIIK